MRSEAIRADAHGWTPDGVARVIAEAQRSGVTHLRLEVASAGITLEISRGGEATVDGEDIPAGDTSAADDRFVAVTAPVLGTFYRRPSPEEEPFVTVGASVNEGDQIGLIEVMKSYHEVVAPASGVITEILAEDGHYVEFGQPLASIRSL